MGRKRKAMHNKRHPCTVSLPVDIHLHLDTIKDKGLTISKYVETLIRQAMASSNQTTLERHVWWCPECDIRFHTSKSISHGVFKHSCGTWLEKDLHYRGTLDEIKKEEEE